MKPVLLATLVAILAATVVVSASASHLPTIGTQLSLFRGNCISQGNLDRPIQPNTIQRAANDAFFVRHGWVSGDWSAMTHDEREAFKDDNTRFDVKVDGTLTAAQRDFEVSEDGTVAVETFLTNFPTGMTGTHVFRGEWYIDGLLIEETPGEAVLSLVCALEVTFV
jgi:hypothetical protein